MVCKRDPASMLIGRILTERWFKPTEKTFGHYRVFEYQGTDLIIIETEHIYAQWLPERYPSDFYIFASRHSAKSKLPTLTVHTTGNWGDALYGGIPNTLSIAPAQHMYASLLALKEGRDKKGLEYKVSYEVTHHGPTLDVPVMFVELGSSEEQWGDEEAAEVVAEAIIAGIKAIDVETAVGVGGGHYAPRFTDIALKKKVAFGHMCPNYALKFLNKDLIRQMVEKTIPRPRYYSIHGDVPEWVPEELENLGLRSI